jgi:hypothetical protein
MPSFDRSRMATLWLVIFAIGLGTAAPAGATGLPDLVVSTVSKPAALLVPTARFPEKVTVGNIGSVGADASQLRLYLSADETKSADDVVMQPGVTVSRIGSQKSLAVSAKLTVPAVPPGIYFIIACADASNAVPESDETNNCLIATASTQILAAYDSTPWGPAKAKSVFPTADRGQALGQFVTRQSGGTLTLNASDGSVFELNIPASALADDTYVFMTPLTAVSGDPLGGSFVAGVAIEPDGLDLADQATLTIQPPSPIAAGEETAVSFHADGSAFHLAPLTPDASTDVMPLQRFATYALFAASAAARTAQRARNAKAPQDAFDQWVEEDVMALRHPGARTAVSNSGIVAGPLRDFYVKVALPLLIQSQFSPTKLAIATATYLLAVRHAILLGAFDTTFTQAELDRDTKIYQRAYTRYLKYIIHNCVTGASNRLALVREAVRLEREAELMGATTPSWFNDQLTACLQSPFPVRWAGTVSGSLTSSGLTESWTASVSIPRFTLADQAADYRSTSPVGTMSWQISGTDSGGCTEQGSATVQTAVALTAYDIPDALQTYDLDVWGNLYAVPITVTCPGQQPHTAYIFPLDIVDPAQSDSQPYTTAMQTLSGSRNYPSQGSIPAQVSFTWSLSASS